MRTAAIRKVDEQPDMIEIPRSVNYNSTEYVIKSIRPYAFYGAKTYFYKPDKAISFAEDSEILIFDDYSFKCSIINSLSIPASLEYLGKGWCEETRLLTKISISPKNKNFVYYDEKMILGKTNIMDDNYDTIYFARRDVDDIRIPSFIKHIEQSAFDCCNKIETFIINEDSELLTIGDYAFASSSINKFIIPSKLDFFGNSWCDDALKLNDIIVSPKNERYMKDEDSKIIFYKSNINNENYDVLFFAPRNIKNVKIPSFIKHFNQYAFAYCQEIVSFIFEDNSQLKSIGNNCFFEANIGEIFLPSSVKTIGKNAFHNSTFKKIEFSQNSDIRIKEMAFFEINLPSITIPASVDKIDDCVFDSSHIKKIEFEKNSKLKIIGKYAFNQCSFKCISIPSSVELIDSLSFSSDAFDIIEIQEEEKNDKNKIKTITIAEDAFEDTNNNLVLFFPACTEIISLSEEKCEEEEEEIKEM